MDLVLFEANGIGKFDRHRVDVDVDPEVVERSHELPVELSHRLRLQFQFTDVAVAGFDHQLVVDEIEAHLEGTVAVGNGRGRQATGGDVERDAPPVIDRRALLQAHLADDLRPHVQSVVGGLPLGQGKWWQVASAASGLLRLPLISLLVVEMTQISR